MEETKDVITLGQWYAVDKHLPGGLHLFGQYIAVTDKNFFHIAVIHRDSDLSKLTLMCKDECTNDKYPESPHFDIAHWMNIGCFWGLAHVGEIRSEIVTPVVEVSHEMDQIKRPTSTR